MHHFLEAAAGWLVRLADALLELHDRAREAAAAELARAAGEAAHALVADALRPARPRRSPPPPVADRPPVRAGGQHPSAPAPWWAAVELCRGIRRRLAGRRAPRWLVLGAAVAELAGRAGRPGGRCL